MGSRAESLSGSFLSDFFLKLSVCVFVELSFLCLLE